MPLTKPAYIADNPVMSEKWDEIVKDREFNPIHATTIEQICYWYAVLRTCQEDTTYEGQIRVAYQNQLGDIKTMPQIPTGMQVSNHIRQLNKQLGINDEVQAEPAQPRKEVPLYVIQGARQTRAQNSRAAKAG